MKFTQKFLKKTKNSNLRCHFAVAFNVSYFTICDWLEKPLQDELTKPKYLPHLISLTDFSEDEIFEKEIYQV